MTGPTTHSIEIDAPAPDVFDALGDARTYPDWLIGAKRIRRVDDGWPAEGSSFHHTVGAGPAVINDRTTILAFDRPHELRLRAGVGPFGDAFVRFTVEQVDRPTRTRVVFTEEPASGVLRLAWRTLGQPIMRLGIWGRNAASLDRLKVFVESGGKGAPERAAGGDSDDLA
jgi:uncharacterized protein YndB with AHSA1/START domain